MMESVIATCASAHLMLRPGPSNTHTQTAQQQPVKMDTFLCQHQISKDSISYKFTNMLAIIFEKYVFLQIMMIF